MGTKKTSLVLDEDLMHQLKLKAVELKTTQRELLEKYIKKGLEEETT